MKRLFLLFTFLLSLLSAAPAQDSTKAVLPPPPSEDKLLPADDPIYSKSVLPVDGPARPKYRGLIRSGKGFRLVIYSGSDRAKAVAAKANFMRIFPHVRAYLSYGAPQFKVKVGDYKSRADAYKMVQVLRPFFKPVMIVPDVIVVNSMRQ